MKQSRTQASLVRQAIRIAWGDGEPTGDMKRALDGSDAIVMRFFRRNEAVLAGPLQGVLEDAFKIKEGNARVPQRIQVLYMHLDEVLSGSTAIGEDHMDHVASKLKELM